jgi:DNA-directed RNA polymerase specialized sigma24 family protein
VKSNADSEGVFEVHFQKHWPRIYGVLFRMVGDAAEAEDLALEVFWQLYQK